MKQKFFLHDDWKFSLYNKNDFDKVPKGIFKPGSLYRAVVPGTIHTDLLKAELISEPFYSDNETRLQWIGDVDWKYRTTFNLPKKFSKDKKTFLVFEGLDTIAEIILNDQKIGDTKNMFRRYKFDVTGIIKERSNSLEIIFTSAVKYGKVQEAKYGKLPVALRSERIYIRKAQYSFGWDWGPTFITAGIWRPVYLLQQDEAAIEDFTFETLSIVKGKALAKLKVNFAGNVDPTFYVQITLTDGKQEIKYEEKLQSGLSELDKEIEIKNPILWQLNELGEPHLYELDIKIKKNGIVLDELKEKVGIRTVYLKLFEDDKYTFKFIINNKQVFLKGVNWIPADSFLPRVSEEKYRALLTAAKNAGMNVIRVWGGGTYESDIFYKICDELGLLVWQDFMFACAAYPEHEEFLENVAEEAAQNVLRLQYHPCIGIWCGNNENEWIWYKEQNDSFTNMPGYRIYHDLLPGIIKNLDRTRPYWESTPFGVNEDPNSQASGNRHQWDMWSAWTDYKKVKDDESLFVTEFGFQSPANLQTIIEVLPEDQKNSQSKIFEFHNKQVEGPERIFKFLSGHLPVRTELNDFIYLSQLNHGLALRECLQHWRLRFPITNGAIIWQLNDCWQVTSWSLIDSGLIPKLPFYLVKNSFKNIFAGFIENEDSVKIVVQNDTYNQFNGSFKVDFISLLKGKVEQSKEKKVKVEAVSQVIVNLIDNIEKIKSGQSIVIVTLMDKNKKIVHRNFLAGLEFKYLKLQKAKIEVKENKKNSIVTVSSDKLALFVNLSSNGKIFEDNGFIILPGEKITTGYKETEKVKSPGNMITVHALNNYF